jgi:protein-S-isoprenylcysteine O-methyltransferase Ste14
VSNESHSAIASLIFRKRGLIGGLVLFPVGAAALVSRPLLLKGTAIEVIGAALGWLLFVCYATFRLWATLYVGGRKEQELQTTGPYSIVRNPLYFGSLAFGLSIICFLHSLSLLLAFAVLTLIYARWVIKSEESVLANKFGEEFQSYCRRVPRLLPSFSAYRAGDSVTVKLHAMKLEARRLWLAVLLPIALQLVVCLRITSHWPQWFTLP